jgi:class 3 adenylate cyclase
MHQEAKGVMEWHRANPSRDEFWPTEPIQDWEEDFPKTPLAPEASDLAMPTLAAPTLAAPDLAAPDLAVSTLEARTPPALPAASEQVETLHHRVAQLESERDDLEILLEGTTQHSDNIEAELHQLNAQLNAQKSELNALFGAIVVYDRQGHCCRVVETQANQAFRDRIGQLDRSLHDLFPPVAAQSLLQGIHTVLSSQEMTQVELCLMSFNPDQPELWIVIHLSLLGPDTVLCVAQDVSARKAVEEELRRERDRSEKLLLSILPAKIAQQLKHSRGRIADNFDNVTILFADIVNFTALASRLKPLALVDMLNDIFSAFDSLAHERSLEKIKTIGDAYMVASGLPDPREDHAEAIADMALAMRHSIHQYEIERQEPLQIRIGINTGTVVAGVIGQQKFIYDLWGDTVNIASRMESSGMANGIQLTESTYLLLKDHYICHPRGEVLIKGKGAMPTYWLQGPQQPLMVQAAHLL